MVELLTAGGVPVWFTLIIGLAGLALAAFTAYEPTLDRVGVCESAQRALLYTTLGGLAGAFAMMFRAASIAATDPKFHDQPDLARQIVLEGASECMSIPIIGFALLGLIALLTTVARMRTTAQ